LGYADGVKPARSPDKRNTPLAVASFVASLMACSSAPVAAPPAVASPQATAPSAQAAAQAEERPSARVLGVSAPSATNKSTRVKIVFSNPTKRPCRVLGYKLVWGDKSKSITLQDLTIPPGETRERWLKIDADEGDVSGLTTEVTKVEMRSECGA
jgi:hypothetical protein